MAQTYRLNDSTVVEPLVNRWGAWACIVAPVSHAMFVKNYQVPLLQSYLRDPELHVKACKEPRMRSGRFLNIPIERKINIEQLLKTTESAEADAIKFAQVAIEFQQFLSREANGISMAKFYSQLPQELSGYVELVYDYFSRPNTRFIEPFLYKSKYYKTNLQSFRLFSLAADNSRDFLLNTPRLSSPAAVEWSTPFHDERVDVLSRLDVSPQPMQVIQEILPPEFASMDQLKQLFTEDTAQNCQRPTHNDSAAAKVSYFGHACVLVEWKGVSILVDPCIGARPTNGGQDRLSFGDLPSKIDYVLITHQHHDHFVLETLLRLRHRIDCLVVPRSHGIVSGDMSLKLLSEQVGFKNVVEVEPLDQIDIRDGAIIAAPFLGEHADLPHSKSSYVVQIGKHRLLFAADSDCLDPYIYRNLREHVGPIQTVFLGLECVGAPLSWSAGPMLPIKPTSEQDQSRRYNGCDAQRGMSLLTAVGANKVFIYAMGLEPWYEYLLGLVHDKNSKQLQQVNELLVKAPAGGVEAMLLCGKSVHLMASG